MNLARLKCSNIQTYQKLSKSSKKLPLFTFRTILHHKLRESWSHDVSTHINVTRQLISIPCAALYSCDICFWPHSESFHWEISKLSRPLGQVLLAQWRIRPTGNFSQFNPTILICNLLLFVNNGMCDATFVRIAWTLACRVSRTRLAIGSIQAMHRRTWEKKKAEKIWFHCVLQPVVQLFSRRLRVWPQRSPIERSATAKPTPEHKRPGDWSTVYWRCKFRSCNNMSTRLYENVPKKLIRNTIHTCYINACTRICVLTQTMRHYWMPVIFAI